MSIRSLTPQRLTAAALIGFVVTLEAQDLVDPTDRAEGAERIAAVAAHPGRLLLAALLLIASSALLIPSIVAIVRRITTRGRTLARTGAVLATLGALGHAAVAGYYGVLAGAPGGDPREMTELLDRIDHSAAAGAVILPAIAGFALGCFVLVLALARSGLLPRWVAVVPLASIVVQAVGFKPWAQIDLSQAVAVMPFAWLGVRLAAHNVIGSRAPAPAYA